MSIHLLAILFTYVSAPMIEMREGPSTNTAVVSQAFHAEQVVPLEKKQDWVKIQTADQYTGWVKASGLLERDYKFIENQGVITARVNRCAAHLYAIKDIEYGPSVTLPYESRLEVLNQFNDANGRWLEVQLVDGSRAFVQRGDIVLNPSPMSLDEALVFSQKFMGLPYTWGGRTSFGYDCSGFTQMIYRQMGIAIPRDAKDQAAWEGFQTVSINEIIPGDLLFFGRKELSIIHVALYLGNGQFIHASSTENKPYVRLNYLTDTTWNGSGDFKYCTVRRLRKSEQKPL